MFRRLNPVDGLLRRKQGQSAAERVYGSIVARARLPVFYRNFGVPDTIDGRFAMLSLHLFAVLHRLKQDGAASRVLAQHLVDCFGADMDTVMRELGVGDIKVPRKMRRLAAANHALLAHYEAALSAGHAALAAAIAELVPLDPEMRGAASGRLASYLMESVQSLAGEPLSRLAAGELDLSDPVSPHEPNAQAGST